MRIEELQKRLETENVEFRGKCHDCDSSVHVLCAANEDGEIVVTGGAMYNPNIERVEQLFFKCDECFKNDKILRKWQPCEVYSRVVGYLRPVNQYNIGKKAEYNMRKEFTLSSNNIKNTSTKEFKE